MLLLNDELLYMQLYVETVKFKSKVLVFDVYEVYIWFIDWLV